MSSPTPAPPGNSNVPCVTINSLPLEVEQRIVEFCAEQDPRFKEWTAAFRNMVKLGQGGYLSMAARELVGDLKDQHRPTLSAISVLKASQTKAGIFRFGIAPRRLHHFTELDLGGCPIDLLDAFLPSLASLPKVRTLIMHESAYKHVLGGSSNLRRATRPQTDCDFATNLLLDLLQRVTSLHLHALRFKDVLALLRATASLRNLHLDLRHSPALLTEIPSFLTIVPSLTVLEASITSLTLRTHSLPRSFLSLAHSFASSLRRLKLVATSAVDYVAELTGLVFPHLTHLSVDCHQYTFGPLITSSTLDALPVLRSLEYRSDEMTSLDINHEVIVVVQQHLDSPQRHLRSLTLADRGVPVHPEEIVFLRDWAAKHDLEITLTPSTPFPAMPLAMQDLDVYTKGEGEQLVVPAVDRIIAFLTSWHDQAKASPLRVSEYKRIAAVLRAAELERVAMES
ncbi:hypothetical protein JCM8547_007110 [Rhodosporidiobolus lusitaniae]